MLSVCSLQKRHPEFGLLQIPVAVISLVALRHCNYHP